MKLDSINYVDEAERVIKSLKVTNGRGEPTLKMTTSKIRNLLSMVSEIFNDTSHLQEEVLPVEMQSRVQYLKLRMAYEAGRERDVKEFIEKANLMILIKNIGKSKEQLLLFCRYMEALVAYHKFYGGKD